MSESVESLFQRATQVLSRGDAAAAIPMYQEALQLRPDHAQTLANLAVAYAELGRHDDAIRFYDAALAQQPNYPEALYNRGNSKRHVRQYQAAIADYDAALRLHADFPQAWVNRGLALMRLGRGAEAVASYQQALARRPLYPEAVNNLGLALQALGYADDAVDHFNEALAQRPGYGAVRSNLAQAWLLRGEFHRGWPEYEWRWSAAVPPPPRDLPVWDGSPLQGKTILLRHEQGLGDTIQFIRYASMVKKRGGRIVLECPERLHSLMNGAADVDALTIREDPAPGCDVQINLLSLPGVFQTDFRTIPNRVPYLSADRERIERWRSLVPPGRLRIGIAWQGNPAFPEDAFRSIPLAAFAPLAAVPGVTLVNLQRKHGLEQVAAFQERHTLHELLDDRDIDGAFIDTAAVMMALDLIVTSDTSIAHLAGALGRPTWVALGVGPEWRWLRDRDDSPWYPTMRLFRQRTVGNWDDVFAHIAAEAAKQINPAA